MSNCGCDENTNLNILQRNNLMPNNNMPNNNMPNNNMSNNNMSNNNMSNNNMSNNNMPNLQIEPNGPINNLIKGKVIEKKIEDPNKYEYIKSLKMILYIILALAIHDAVKFFISQSIRLNRGSSSRFIYYPIIILGILILINFF